MDMAVQQNSNATTPKLELRVPGRPNVTTAADHPRTHEAGKVKKRRVSHLLRNANPKALCENCSHNADYLKKLVNVFEVINIISTIIGFGVLLGYAHGNWTHLSLLALVVWSFSAGLGTAIMDEYTTKPSMRFRTASLFLAMLLISITTSIAPFVLLIAGLWMELAGKPEYFNPVPESLTVLISCDTEKHFMAANLNSSNIHHGCTYSSPNLIPSWQLLHEMKWLAYAITLTAMLAGIIVWFYGLFCYFARLSCVKKVFSKGGQVDCVPYQFKSEWKFLSKGHIEDEKLEDQLLDYFGNLERRKTESLEEFLELVCSQQYNSRNLEKLSTILEIDAQESQ